jgi:hypothetical protein
METLAPLSDMLRMNCLPTSTDTASARCLQLGCHFKEADP